VYLDAPFPRFLVTHFGDDDLQQALLMTYLESWGLMGGRPGLGPILGTGAVFASSDDHEFWNNAPARGAVVRNTWTSQDRATWRALATDLYRTFQTSSASASFAVDQLSFRVIDTRLDRAEDRSILISAAELAALDAWIRGLTGPGVLMLGQTIFGARAGWKGQFLDWGLPDFRQYEDIVRCLMASQHDVVVMTGDVHYGRISGCRLPSGASLFEVVSSPLALVDERAGGKFREPPGMFPAFGIPGTTQSNVWCDSNYRVEGNHFATVGFRSLGPRVRMNVRAWPIARDGAVPVVTNSFERDLG
jgi:hypothetical protein